MRRASKLADRACLVWKEPTLAEDKLNLYREPKEAKKYSGNVSRVDVDKFTAFANRQKRDNQYPAQLFLFRTTSDFNSNAQKEIEKNYFIGLNGLHIAKCVYGYLISIDYDGVDYLKDFFHHS